MNTETDKAALIFHEAVYKAVRSINPNSKDSLFSRKIVGYVFSDLTPEQYPFRREYTDRLNPEVGKEHFASYGYGKDERSILLVGFIVKVVPDKNCKKDSRFEVVLKLGGATSHIPDYTILDPNIEKFLLLPIDRWNPNFATVIFQRYVKGPFTKQTTGKCGFRVEVNGQDVTGTTNFMHQPVLDIYPRN